MGRWGNHELRVYRKILVGEQDAWPSAPPFSGAFTVFERIVEWAVGHGIETATFHILTLYPGTELYARMHKAGRIVHSDWDLYDTRHVVYRPARLSPEALEEGYWWAYKDFYRWGNILRGAYRPSRPCATGPVTWPTPAAGSGSSPCGTG